MKNILGDHVGLHLTTFSMWAIVMNMHKDRMKIVDNYDTPSIACDTLHGY